MKDLTLICVATLVEAKACRRGIASSGRKDQFEILQTGMGMARARRALETRLADQTRPHPALVISSGLAGSRHREISVGSWIFGEWVETEHLGKSFACANDFGLDRLSFQLQPARVITLLKAETQTHALAPVSADALPVVIDMESHAWAEVCHAREIPFRVLRVISDNPDAPLPSAVGFFASALNADIPQKQVKDFAQGLFSLATEPHRMARFLYQSSRLPKVLEMGWKELALL
jgi:hypothetical protein